MTNSPTHRQSQVLAFIRDYIAVKGYSPTVREIAAFFGFSTTAAYGHVMLLTKKGAIQRDSGVARSMRPTT